MRNNFFFLITFVSILTIASCKKDTSSDVSPTPTYTFYFNGPVNFSNVNLQAGANNYYMFTSYALDGNGVYDFMGELRDRNTSTGSANSLRIYLKDYRPYSPLPTITDSSVAPGFCSYAKPIGAASRFSVQFTDTLFNGAVLANAWSFGDGYLSTQHNPVHIYSHPGIYNASYTASNVSGNFSLNNDVMIGQVGNAFLSSLSVSFVTGNTINWAGFPGGVPNTTFRLDFGDGNFSSTTNWNNTYTTNGVYQATLTATDATGYTEVTRYNGATSGNTSPYADFDRVSITPIANPQNLSTVTIEWTDASGALYISNSNAQPSSSSFKIISVDPYQNNVAGQATLKIHAQVSCMLYNGSNSIPFSGEVIFSVAHP